jgi:hypothetical protein
MRAVLVAFGVGFVFALGLGISGMTQPKNVQGFLDIFGDWKPALLFVMMGAVITHFLFYLQIKRRSSPLFDVRFHLPTRRDLDPRLLVGSILFGVGWGLSGLCPGPALVSSITGNTSVLVFLAAMVVGMLVFRAGEKALKAIDRK